MGDLLTFHRDRCSLCGSTLDPARAARFSEHDQRNGRGCRCGRRTLALVGATPADPSVFRPEFRPDPTRPGSPQ